MHPDYKSGRLTLQRSEILVADKPTNDSAPEERHFRIRPNLYDCYSTSIWC